VPADSQEPAPASPRPGALRRAAGGAWHVAAGFGLLLRSPALWGLALPLALLTGVLVGAGALLGALSLPRMEMAFMPRGPSIPDWLDVSLLLTLSGGVVLGGMMIGLALSLLVGWPLLDRLSARAEARVCGRVSEPGRSLGWQIVERLRVGLYLLAAAPGVYLLGLLPVVGPVLGVFWGAHVIGLHQVDVPLARRGLDFATRWQWRRRFLAESFGFGLAAVTTLVVPVVNVLLAPLLPPALAVGSALLVAELESPPRSQTEPAEPDAGS